MNVKISRSTRGATGFYVVHLSTSFEVGHDFVQYAAVCL